MDNAVKEGHSIKGTTKGGSFLLGWKSEKFAMMSYLSQPAWVRFQYALLVVNNALSRTMHIQRYRF